MLLLRREVAITEKKAKLVDEKQQNKTKRARSKTRSAEAGFPHQVRLG